MTYLTIVLGLMVMSAGFTSALRCFQCADTGKDEQSCDYAKLRPEGCFLNAKGCLTAKTGKTTIMKSCWDGNKPQAFIGVNNCPSPKQPLTVNWTVCACEGDACNTGSPKAAMYFTSYLTFPIWFLLLKAF